MLGKAVLQKEKKMYSLIRVSMGGYQPYEEECYCCPTRTGLMFKLRKHIALQNAACNELECWRGLNLKISGIGGVSLSTDSISADLRYHKC